MKQKHPGETPNPACIKQMPAEKTRKRWQPARIHLPLWGELQTSLPWRLHNLLSAAMTSGERQGAGGEDHQTCSEHHLGSPYLWRCWRHRRGPGAEVGHTAPARAPNRPRGPVSFGSAASPGPQSVHDTLSPRVAPLLANRTTYHRPTGGHSALGSASVSPWEDVSKGHVQWHLDKPPF